MNKIEIIVRALILKESKPRSRTSSLRGKILLCKMMGDRHYFLPGGHLEFGESARKALSRELKEELGAKSETGSLLIGVCEHIYPKKGEKHHEINLIFKVRVGEIDLKGKPGSRKISLPGREKKLKFYLKDLKEFKKIYFLPKNLKTALLDYFKNKKFFWIGLTSGVKPAGVKDENIIFKK